MKELIQKYWKQVVAALALAIAGNFAYDLFKTGSVSLASLIWNASTLGIKVVQDSAYIEMTRGPRETAAMTTLYLVGFLSTSIAGGFAGSVANLYLQAKSLRPSTGTEQSTVEVKEPDHLALRLERRAKRLAFSVSFLVLLFCFTSAIVVARASFISDGVTWFAQSMRVLAPHLSEMQEERLWARFAGMQGKKNFEEISAEMLDLARKLDTSLPNLRN